MHPVRRFSGGHLSSSVIFTGNYQEFPTNTASKATVIETGKKFDWTFGPVIPWFSLARTRIHRTRTLSQWKRQFYTKFKKLELHFFVSFHLQPWWTLISFSGGGKCSPGPKFITSGQKDTWVWHRPRFLEWWNFYAYDTVRPVKRLSFQKTILLWKTSYLKRPLLLSGLYTYKYHIMYNRFSAHEWKLALCHAYS